MLEKRQDATGLFRASRFAEEKHGGFWTRMCWNLEPDLPKICHITDTLKYVLYTNMVGQTMSRKILTIELTKLPPSWTERNYASEKCSAHKRVSLARKTSLLLWERVKQNSIIKSWSCEPSGRYPAGEKEKQKMITVWWDKLLNFK